MVSFGSLHQVIQNGSKVPSYNNSTFHIYSCGLPTGNYIDQKESGTYPRAKLYYAKNNSATYIGSKSRFNGYKTSFEFELSRRIPEKSLLFKTTTAQLSNNSKFYGKRLKLLRFLAGIIAKFGSHLGHNRVPTIARCFAPRYNNKKFISSASYAYGPALSLNKVK